MRQPKPCGCRVKPVLDTSRTHPVYHDQILYCPLHASAPRLMVALREAIELIQSEYCSHPEPHSPTLTTCYSSKQLDALAHAEGKGEG